MYKRQLCKWVAAGTPHLCARGGDACAFSHNRNNFDAYGQRLQKIQSKSSWLDQGDEGAEWSAEEWARWEQDEQAKWDQIATEIRNNFGSSAAAFPTGASEGPGETISANPKDWPAPVGLKFFQQGYMSKYSTLDEEARTPLSLIHI